MAQSEEKPCYPVGVEYNSVNDIKNCVNAAVTKYGFECCIMPISHPLFKREHLSGKCKDNYVPFTRSDTLLQGYDWQFIFGKTSPYIDCDSPDDNYRRSSEETFLQELLYASHLSLPGILHSLHGPNNENLARLLHPHHDKTSSLQVWIVVPLGCPTSAANYYRSNIDPDFKENDTWHWWNSLRHLCNSERNIGVGLEIGADLPDDDILERWLGEPLRCALLPTNIFVTNKKGFPVLTRCHQKFVRDLTKINCKLFITGVCRHESIEHYRRYIEFLAKQVQPDPMKQYTEGFDDYLQYPLQPLADNLESSTYEIFEKDPIKYKKYQDAIYNALLDRVPDEQIETNVQVVMVAGAGRGPLVGAVLNASQNSGRKVRVYAVEKNPNAIVTLLHLQNERWGNQVTILRTDMRTFQPPEKVDILVSELLGSFGDNELSPECLDGVQKVLKEDGISIPSSYTSYLSPIQSMRLFSEIRGYKERHKHPLSNYEMPYVVFQKNKYQIGDVLPVFTFTHPNKDDPVDNSRYVVLRFKIKNDCVLHGFSGFFSAVLYKDIFISIEPSTASVGMFSWFPVYFPVKEPINLTAGDELVTHFWRVCNETAVWYEWCISKPTPVSIHNPHGRSYSIKLY